jgi:hypothetical protein
MKQFITTFQAFAGLCGGVLLGTFVPACAETDLIASIEVSTPVAGPSDGTYWMQARAAVIPAKHADATPRVVITLQKIDRQGTHMYHGLAAMWSEDVGKNWTDPTPIKAVDRRLESSGLFDAPVDMTPQFHRQSGKLLATGASIWLDSAIRRDPLELSSDTAYTTYDPSRGAWSNWQKLKMPDDPKFHVARAGCTQRVDLPNGDILLPIYFHAKPSKGKATVHFAAVVRCTFDGTTLRYQEHGNELAVDVNAKRNRTGLYEPSLVSFNGKYLLTLRADNGAYVASSSDGLHFSNLKPWQFDDGTLLGSYNTQQHWIAHSDALYLVYTRRGAKNNNVFRHRAPLFLAQVDPQRLVVLRDTERIVLPNLGKGFGNFGVCSISEEETWVVDCLTQAAPGTPNVFIASIFWSKPNRLFD